MSARESESDSERAPPSGIDLDRPKSIPLEIDSASRSDLGNRNAEIAPALLLRLICRRGGSELRWRKAGPLDRAGGVKKAAVPARASFRGGSERKGCAGETRSRWDWACERGEEAALSLSLQALGTVELSLSLQA